MIPVSESVQVPRLRKANKAEAMEFFDISAPTLDAWLRRGCPCAQRGMRGVPWILDLLAIAEWRFGRNAQESKDINPEDLSPKERKDWYEGEKVRIALEIDKGNLVTLDQYREEMARILKQVANALETLPDALERQCALLPSTVMALQKELDKERTALVTKLEVIDGCGAA